MNCPGCGHPNPEEARFCNACGAGLAEAAREPDPRAYTPAHLARKILTQRSAIEGERKQVTVLFADVKGSMELAEAVDPEEWHAVLDRFFQILAEGVHRFEGTVNQYTGDGIMALFGAPLAHEDHAHRACLAALHLHEALRDYADELRRTRGLNFSVRMGLNSGEVIVGKIGDDLRMDYTAQGHSVGLAQRIEQLAPSGCTYLTDHTARLVEGFFTLRDLGSFELKGVREPLRVFELAGTGTRRTRLDRSRAHGFSRFVGREGEMASLERWLGEVGEGRGRVVAVVGAAGVGKSRLCVEFLERCLQLGLPVDRAHCPPHGATLPFLPVRELLRGIFELAEGDRDEEARRKIAGTLVLLGEVDPAGLSDVFDFLGVADPAAETPSGDPESRRTRLLDFVERLIRARAARGTPVLLWDDVHWIDPASERALARIIATARDARVLVLANFRPEYQASWLREPWVERLDLEPLGPGALAALLDDLLGGHADLAPLRERIAERTGGNPFFTEEVVQSLAESGALLGARGAYTPGRDIDRIRIPATVQPILAARIDRLRDADKRLLQRAAVIGKRFAEPLLNRVAGLSEADFQSSLMALQDGEFLRVETLFPQVEYAFKHPLTREVAYDAQLGAARAALHGEVARALEEMDPDKLDERAALIAHHREAAGEDLEAARWHLRAVGWLGGNDLESTVRHLRRCSALAARAPESEEADRLRLAAVTALTSNYQSQHLEPGEVEAAFAQGHALAERVDDARARFTLHIIEAIRYQQLGEWESHDRCVEQARSLFPSHDPETRFVLGFQSGLSRSKRGEAEAALRELDDAAQVIDRAERLLHDLVSRSAYLGYFVCRGSVLRHLGRLDEAQDTLERALALAHEHGSVAFQADALASLVAVARARGDADAAGRLALELEEVSPALGSALWEAATHLARGTAELEAGRAPAAAQRLERGIAILREQGVPSDWQALAWAALSSARLGARDPAGALEAAEQALGCAERLADLDAEVGAHLCRARALLERDGAASGREVEVLLERSVALVERTGARLWAPQIEELRAGLAEARGDAGARVAALGRARELYGEMNASGHAARVERRLGASGEAEETV